MPFKKKQLFFISLRKDLGKIIEELKKENLLCKYYLLSMKLARRRIQQWQFSNNL